MRRYAARPARPALSALAALLLLASLAPPAIASPQPTPVCGPCGAGFERAAEKQGVDANVTESTAVVRVHPNGSATWTVRNRLGSGADLLRREPDRLDRVADALAADRHRLLADATLVDARLDGDVAVLTFRDPDAVSRHAGLLVVDSLHDRGREPWYHVNADRFAILGPEGTVVANDPESGAVDGNRVTWRGQAGVLYAPGTDLEGSPYVVFAPERGGLTGVQVDAALALATLPIVLTSVRLFLLLQTGLYAAVLAGVVYAFRAFRPTWSARRVAAAVLGVFVAGAAVGGAMRALGALDPGPTWVSGPPLFALALGLAAAVPGSRSRLDTVPRQALAAAGLLAAVGVALAGVYAATAAVERPVAFAVRNVAVTLPLALLLPLGAALGADRRRRTRWGALAVAGFALVPPAVVDFADPPLGLGGFFYTVLFTGAAVAIPVLGSFVLALGYALAAGADGEVVGGPDGCGGDEDADAARVTDETA